MSETEKAVLRKKDWVQWLEEKNRPKEKTAFEKYFDLCLKAATEIGQKYHMDLAEVVISNESVHVNYKKGSKLYLNVIPRALIIRTCRITPHIEKAVRIQLIRQIKRDKQSQR